MFKLSLIFNGVKEQSAGNLFFCFFFIYRFSFTTDTWWFTWWSGCFCQCYFNNFKYLHPIDTHFVWHCQHFWTCCLLIRCTISWFRVYDFFLCLMKKWDINISKPKLDKQTYINNGSISGHNSKNLQNKYNMV